jgi:hypothetical protein
MALDPVAAHHYCRRYFQASLLLQALELAQVQVSSRLVEKSPLVLQVPLFAHWQLEPRWYCH